jgi:hypothetical protein
MRNFITISVAILILGAAGIAQAAKRPIAAIREVNGIVNLVKVETEKKIAANPGALLYPGDALSTKNKSTVAILFTDGSLLKIRENTDVTLQVDRKTNGNLDTKVKVPLGKIWAKVTRRETKFEVETPSSVASVKGTELAVFVNDNGGSELQVFAGIVGFSNEFGSVDVRKNQKSQATPGQPPAEPQKLTKKDKRENEEQKKDGGNTWKLDIKAPSGKPVKNKSFRLKVSSYDIGSQTLDTKFSSEIIVSSATEGAQFSLDGVEWNDEVNSPLVNGTLTFFAKGSEVGDMQVNAQGSDCRQGKISVEVTEGTGADSDPETELVHAILAKMGLSGAAARAYISGLVREGSGDFETILRRIQSGQMDVFGYEVVDMPGGYQKIVIRAKNAESGN